MFQSMTIAVTSLESATVLLSAKVRCSTARRNAAVPTATFGRLLVQRTNRGATTKSATNAMAVMISSFFTNGSWWRWRRGERVLRLKRVHLLVGHQPDYLCHARGRGTVLWV